MNESQVDKVVAVMSQFRDGLNKNALMKLAHIDHHAVGLILAELKAIGAAECVPHYPGAFRKVWRLTGEGRPVIQIPKPNRHGPIPSKARLKPAPRLRTALNPPVAPPELPATWRHRWGRLDGRRELEVLVTADAEFVYVTHWQNCRGTWIPRKGALRLKKLEAEQLHDALGTALDYAR